VVLVEHEGRSTILHLDVDGYTLRARTHPDRVPRSASAAG